MNICKYCNTKNIANNAIANHTKWCHKNPKRSEYIQNLNKARSSIKNRKNQYSYGTTCSEETRQKISKTSKGRLHNESTKQLLREKALASSHRRLKKSMVEYNGILLDSSWELELAKRLDELNIKWTRPDPIPWIDDNSVTHNYFPDFYLEEYDLFLDPKNPQAIKTQKKKLMNLLTQYSNIVIIDSLEKCKTYRP